MSTTGVVVATATGTLAAMFATSGVSKLRRPFDSALAMVRFGVLRRIRPAAGRALGAVELLLAVALVAAPEPFVATLAAAGVLAVFTALVAWALAHGRSFECACFGAGERISWITVARNIAFIALAAAVALATAPGGAFVAAGLGDRALGVLVGALVMCAVALVSVLVTLNPFATRIETAGDVDG
ncbi:MauE/DoxX family redox-associated membrane protein [Asanoa sp. NPDC049573]|uniref:MauE/DoxX family redox-associated membrane protein n=1 Tax=Asanoa sp. NPDC049573 TaxID=3155396 RepID=UPI003437774E